ncbi:MAG: hypothetical protein AAFX87_05595 [Bacteroidota bacterium]
MKFVVGYFSEQLSTLEKLREQKKDEKLAKRNSAKELESFLDKFGYGGEGQISADIEFTQKKLKEAQEEQSKVQKGYNIDTHSSDDLRQSIRNLIRRIDRTETALNDLDYKINEQETLRAELMSSKFKLARSKSVVDIFANVAFEKCPSCGTDIQKREKKKGHCGLCQSEVEAEKGSASVPHEEAFRLDLDARINELELSIKEHKRAYNRQKNLLVKLKRTKYDLDLKLRSQVERYESTLLSTYRDIDRRIATYKERLSNYENVKLIPEEIARLEKEADQLVADDLELKRKIEAEKSKLTKAGDYIEEIQDEFLRIMIAVGLPGVNGNDEIIINKKTWDVSVLPDGEEVFAWNFNNAGSGGKKTLFKVCYGLALHLVAARNNLPLPKFLIIDTPMKNIGEEVNKDIFEKFYKILYKLNKEDLSSHQFIIVDKEFIEPEGDSDLDIFERYMTPDEKEHPPLISYYRGA